MCLSVWTKNNCEIRFYENLNNIFEKRWACLNESSCAYSRISRPVNRLRHVICHAYPNHPEQKRRFVHTQWEMSGEQPCYTLINNPLETEVPNEQQLKHDLGEGISTAFSFYACIRLWSGCGVYTLSCYVGCVFMCYMLC